MGDVIYPNEILDILPSVFGMLGCGGVWKNICIDDASPLPPSSPTSFLYTNLSVPQALESILL